MQGKRKARRAGLSLPLQALKFPCAARIPRSIVASQEHVALIVDQRNRLILLYNKNVAAKVPDQISGNAANEYVGDVRKTALTADN